MPALGVLALLVWWMAASGGYGSTVWLPAGLVALALAGWMAVVRPEGMRIGAPPAGRALAVFGALVALNYLSMLWAGSAGNALNAADQLALYLVMAWILAALPWTPGRLAGALSVWSIAIAVVCLVALLRALSAADLSSFFSDQRFSTPMDYSNATGALAVMGTWPALILSARRELSIKLRVPLLVVAVFLAGYAVLPQSRAALFGMGGTAILVAILIRPRIGVLLRLALAAGAVALMIPRALALGSAASAGHGVGAAMRRAGVGLLIASIGTLVLGGALILVETALRRRREAAGRAPWRPSVGLRRTGAIALGVVIVAAAIAGTPLVHAVRTAVRNGGADSSVGANRFISLAPEERVDYARVALRLARAHPVLGVGAGNFGRQYDAQRRFTKHSAYTHDLVLRVLAETGAVGLIVFVALLAMLLSGLARLIRGDTLIRACAVAALACATYFLVHASFDWMDEFPALAVPALGLPLAALTLRGENRVGRLGPRGQSSHRWAGRLWTGAGVLAAATMLVALASAYLEGAYVRRTFAVYRADPAAAYSALASARSVDPFSAEPLTTEGTIALYLGDPIRAAAAFRRSVAKEDDWYPRLELALIEAGRGKFVTARREIAAAIRLDASDPGLEQAARDIAARRRVDAIAFNRVILQEGDVGGGTGRLR